MGQGRLRVLTDTAPGHGRRALDVLFVLPPDFDAPLQQKVHRFPPQGPALVAAAVRPTGASFTLCDLEQSVIERPLEVSNAPCADDGLVEAFLRGEPSPELEAVLDALLSRLPPPPYDVVAISLERHTQISPAILLAAALKRRHDAPVLIGGTAARQCRELLEQAGALGIDFVTSAQTPAEIRLAFAALAEVPRGRRAPVAEPVRGEHPTPPDEWPVPDFSIYALERYRRDPIAAEPLFGRYDGRLGARLVLPYNFAFDCQFACVFCQRGGRQSAKSPSVVVRDLAELAERYQASDFMFFDSQINLLAGDLARELIAASLGVRWTDSYRVLPYHEGELELMARAGCIGLTVGVESASDEMLKRMVKGHRRIHATRLVKEAHEHELMLRVNLLSCFPGEREHHHRETCDWVRDNAFGIDDLAPSSFYLMPDSPIGRAPEKYGLRVRGPRRTEGSYRFRKFIGSLAFDEVDGLSWEEREPLLRLTESELREAGLAGRGERAAVREIKSAMMFALRASFARKSDAFDALATWAGHQGRAAGARGDAAAEAGHAPSTGSPPAMNDAGERLPVFEPIVDDEAVAERLRALLHDASGEIVRFGTPGAIGHVLLFQDDDYLCFSARAADGAPGTVAIDNVLAAQFRSVPRRPLYRRLVPGTRLRIDGAAIELAAGDAAARFDEAAALLTFRFHWMRASAASAPPPRAHAAGVPA